jgi:cytochrome c biogenesis protein CcmG/thiol:disulfide interchange protein DsbE
MHGIAFPMQLRISATLLLVAMLSYGADVKLSLLKVGDTYYTNVVITKASATDIYFQHSRGMGNAKLKNLDAEAQKLFKYDPAKASEAEKNQAQANYAYHSSATKISPTTRTPASQSAQPAGDEHVKPADIPVARIHAKSVRGEPAPKMVIEKWLSGQPVMIGKFVMIDFWATWCGPCRQSIPEINKLHAKFKDQMVIIGLSDEEENEVRAMKTPVIDYYKAIDRSANMKNALAIQGIPHAIIIDPKGIVRFEGHPAYLNEQNVAGLIAKYSN